MGAERVGAEAALDRIRAFFALPLPEEQRRILAAYLDTCRERAPEFRWSDAGNLHMTVRFVGSVDRALVEGIASRLSGSAFEIALGEIGAFRRGKLARVVWMGVREGASPLRALAEHVESECRAAGLEPEKRPFTAHLTLARARSRGGSPLPELPAAPELEPWVANELVLYSSHLGRGGAVHEPIRVVRLLPE